jgi:hypothetical protein
MLTISKNNVNNLEIYLKSNPDRNKKLKAA